MTTVAGAVTSTPLPAGFRIGLDPAAREIGPGIWFGGSPARIIRLTGAGQAAFRELLAGPVGSAAAGALARRLTDAQFAHPVPPAWPASGRPDVTVVIPARDRADLLDRCLAGLGPGGQVLVVDDGSHDAGAVAATSARHGATLIRRPVNGGPAAARNTALGQVRTELIAFIDSDCEPSPGWIGPLAAHFADPLVAAVAPRITALAGGSWAGRYTAACGPLDLGGRPARVLPGSQVSYVPTAALLVRREALAGLAGPVGAGAVFDERLRSGEDVDLVWRLHEAGWRVRYDPSVRIGHHEPATWRGLLSRRFRYGTSAAPLTRRHPGDVPPLVLHPWPALAVAAALGRRPATAAAAYAASVATLGRTLRRAGVPRRGTARAMASAAWQTYLGTGRYATQFAAPALAAAIACPGVRGAGRRARNRAAWRRLAAGSLLLAPPLAAWAAGPRELDPARFVLGRITDDVAYGLGVWSGCRRERTVAPVLPRVAWRPVTTQPAASGKDEQ
ncbi:MAG TPA: mycofactocin biosynthesis glycosyltransferase MftF [Streptosporangiaceae bacterium]